MSADRAHPATQRRLTIQTELAASLREYGIAKYEQGARRLTEQGVEATLSRYHEKLGQLILAAQEEGLALYRPDRIQA